jgi:hypothetical protein
VIGRYQILPVVLLRDQHLDVILDHEGRFVELRETVPPRVNYQRIDEPRRHLEIETRKREWAEREAVAFAPEHPNYREQYQRMGEQTT